MGQAPACSLQDKGLPGRTAQLLEAGKQTVDTGGADTYKMHGTFQPFQGGKRYLFILRMGDVVPAEGLDQPGQAGYL